MYNPTVIDNNGKSERAYDIYSRLLKDRIIFVGTAIDEKCCKLNNSTIIVP